MSKSEKCPPRIRLGRGDIEIFYLLFEYRIITAEQFCRYYDKEWKRDAGMPRRLQRLARAGYILNPTQAPSCHHYVLADGGADLLKHEYRNLMPKKGSWNAFGERLKSSAFNEHDTCTVDFMLELERRNSQKDEPFLIRRSDLLARPNLGARKIPLAWNTELFWNQQYHDVRVCPDWVFGIVGEGGKERTYFLEMDMGTEPQMRNAFDRNQSILRKLLSYSHTYEQKSAFEDLQIDRFSVLFSTTSARRVENMQKLFNQYALDIAPASLAVFQDRASGFMFLNSKGAPHHLL